jgi:hypothetical protein
VVSRQCGAPAEALKALASRGAKTDFEVLQYVSSI